MTSKLTLFLLVGVCSFPAFLAEQFEKDESCEFLSLGAGYFCCFDKPCCTQMVNAHRCYKSFNAETQQFIVTPPKAAVELQCERSFKDEDLTKVCCVATGAEEEHCYCPAPRRWCE